MRLPVTLIAALALIAASCTYESSGTTTTTEAIEVVEPAPTGPADIVFDPQRIEGSAVIVESVTLPSAGWIVLQTDDQGAPGEIVGISELLNPGATANVIVPFFALLDAEAVVHATVHIDVDQDGIFTFEPPDAFVDEPGIAASGEVARASALIGLLPTLVGGEIFMEDQRSDGSEVVVATVVLPAPGFVTIQLDEGGAPGTVLGATGLLPAGASTELEIQIDPPLGSSGVVWAVAYVDRNEDGELQVEGTDRDAPAQFTEGEATILSAQITVVRTSGAAVEVDDQESQGDIIFISSASLPSSGFLRLSRDADGAPGEVVAESDLLDAGNQVEFAFEFDPVLTGPGVFWIEVIIDFDADGELTGADPVAFTEGNRRARASFQVELPPTPDDGDGQ